MSVSVNSRKLNIHRILFYEIKKYLGFVMVYELIAVACECVNNLKTLRYILTHLHLVIVTHCRHYNAYKQAIAYNYNTIICSNSKQLSIR